MSISPIKAVILAGGSGTRLWPLSRMQLPKQFLQLQGDHTLLDSTVHRLAPLIKQEDVLVVTGAEHAKGEAYSSLQPYQTLLEPEGRNTAPAIALAAAWLQLYGGEDDPVMVVLPADHIIKDTQAFQNALQQAIEGAKQGSLVTFGIKPTRADTGFGYIEVAPNSGEDTTLTPVVQFTEKPDEPTAQQYLENGNHLWNSGMFVWKASSILKEIDQHLPEVSQKIEEVMSEWQARSVSSGSEGQTMLASDGVDRGLWSQLPNISIDYGVLEKSDNVMLIPCDIGWSDVGSWDALHEVSEQDQCRNAIQGRVIAKDCHNSLIHSNQRLVAAVGVEDLCIVETQDALLVTKRGESQRVREIVDELKQDDSAQEHLYHCTVNRPWGSYTVLEEHDGYKMKRITVVPGASLSLQSHQHRSEHWIVVSGTATVIRNEKIETISKNQSTYIPIGMRHRLENRGKIPLAIIEVQVGDYLEEDDIERFCDTYGRS